MPATVSDELPEQRVLEQSIRLPAGGGVTGWASCRLWGAAYFDGLAPDGITLVPVPLAIGNQSSIRPDSAITVSRERLDPDEVVNLQGIPCTALSRAVFDAMRDADDVREATVAMDMVAAAELTSIKRVRAGVESTRAGWKGVETVRRALDLAREGSRSPNETRMRLTWDLDAGLPPPLINQPVFDLSGRLLGLADLLDPVAGVVGEYDGAAHRAARRHRRDVLREDLMRRAGLEYFKVVGGDLDDRPLVVERMLSTRSRAKFLPPGRRAWTLDPPAGWYDSPLDYMTLDERLDHRDELRSLAADTGTVLV